MDPMEEEQDELGLGLTSGFKFEPDDDEVVDQYLLRRILGQQLPLEGVIIDDDPRSAPPWELFKKHKREDDAFFFANGQTMNDKGNRQKRTCGKDGSHGTWEGQKPLVDGARLRVDDDSGTVITWRKYMLNFHATGEKGSMGWVMHEYSITGPEDLASSSLRLYRIRFSGHGKNCKREPDGYGAQATAEDPDLLEEQFSAANSVFHTVAAVDLVDDEDGGSAWPTSYSDQVYQHQPANATYDWTQQNSFQDLAGANLGNYDAGPGSHQYFLGGNTMDLGDQGVMNEYDVAAPAAEVLPSGEGSFSGDEPFMDFELSDLQDFDMDEFLVFPDDPCGLEEPLHDQ